MTDTFINEEKPIIYELIDIKGVVRFFKPIIWYFSSFFYSFETYFNQ